jgi:hypothetical protein
MAKFTTYITEDGWRTLLSKGFLDTIDSFTLQDETIIYGIDDGVNNPAFYDLPIVGSKNGSTMKPNCSFAQRKAIPVEELTDTEIKMTDSRVKLAFISEDCSVPFEKSNVTVTVNIEKWVSDLLALKSVDYVRTVSGLRLDFWDYVVGYLQEYDLATSTWIDKEIYKDNLDIRYVLKSESDYKKYRMANPKYMSIIGGRKKFVNEQSKVRFGSNMILGFKTNSVDGVSVYNTAGYLGLFPDYWGYVVDGVFQNAGDFEDSVKTTGLDIYDTVYPAVVIDGVNYWLKTDTDYRSVDSVGYMVYGFESKEGVKAIDALTDKVKLFMKSNGTEIETGVYQIKIEFDTALLSNNMFNQAYQNKNIGGNLIFELNYNTNSVSSEKVIIG